MDLALVDRSAPARQGEPPHPCLLLLHGRGADERDLLGLAPLLDPRFLLVAARAPLPVLGVGGFQWHEALAMGRPEPVSQMRSLGRLREFLGQIADAFPVDPERVFVLGFSQGAAMALCLGAEVAGTLALSGYLTPLCRTETLAGRPLFVGHGTGDPVVPVALGRGVRDALTAAGADLTYREYGMGHQIVEQEIDDINTWLGERLTAAAPPG